MDMNRELGFGGPIKTGKVRKWANRRDGERLRERSFFSGPRLTVGNLLEVISRVDTEDVPS